MNTIMPATRSETAEALATTLLANLGAFQSFARKRLHDDDLAADAVQEALLRALKAAPRLSHGEKLLAWFYRILRNVLIDLYRHQHREADKLTGFEQERNAADREVETAACACLQGVLPALPPEYAEVIQRIDLQDEEPRSVAEELGVSGNLLKVRLHRARRQLRSRLEQTCRACATHGCLDCTCDMKEETK